MPKSGILDQIKLGRKRYAMAQTVVRLVEGFRADYMPQVKPWDTFALLFILRKMLEQQMSARPSSASTLSRALGMPRTTVSRKLAILRRIGAIEQHGSRFEVLATYMNSPEMVMGFKRRRDMVQSAAKKMADSDA
jgi:biotin operon repressor